MKKYSVDRKEKNRRHLASFISVVFGALLMLGYHFVGMMPAISALASGGVFLVIMILRTIFIELGIRRGGPLEAEQDRKKANRRHLSTFVAVFFGIFILGLCYFYFRITTALSTLVYGVVFLLIIVLRTIIIELGSRRSEPTEAEQAEALKP